MDYYAHTARGPGGEQLSDKGRWQLLREHLSRVAALARHFAGLLDLGEEAELAGLLHDLGKYAARFQARLNDDTIHGINHWSAGAVHAGLVMKKPSVAFSIDGHHTGIPALTDNAGLKQTLSRHKTLRDWQEHTGCSESVTDLLERLQNHDGLSLPAVSQDKVDDCFEFALRTRMLFSCLVDADFLDTEAHFDPQALVHRTLPELQADQALTRLKKILAQKSTNGEINQRRRRLLTDCLTAALKAPGLFTLTAPTGSGKTLSSLAFALGHIVHHNARLSADDSRRLRRIIVVIPFTSIIEQTAQVYRDLFEPIFGPDFVLEHHSAVAPRERSEDRARDAEEERLRRARLAAENWASPLVITTSVQFFESLFSNRASDCRKLHNIARSVILFDEVQTLPTRLVPSLLSAVKLLTQEPYGSSAVFMTATQPAFAAAGKALCYGWNPIEISSEPKAMAESLRRTRIELPGPDEKCSWENIASQLMCNAQALCVVNTTGDARRLFEIMKLRSCKNLFHLSSRLCPEHRREKLNEIRACLRDGLPCRLVSTQLIEAGVDVDFPIAFRALGPLDSIIQTAGRCNREGRQPHPCPVVVFRPEEGGFLPKSYEQIMKITETFLHGVDPDSLHLPETYARYFAFLYGINGPDKAEADKVFDYSVKLDFPKAAEACRLVGEGTHAVLVKWTNKHGLNRGGELAEKLQIKKHLTADECREAQRFSVNLYQSKFLEAQQKEYIYQPSKNWDFWVWNSDYDSDLGLGHLDVTTLTL